MKKQIASIITFCRILGRVGLVFCPVFSAGFYGLCLFLLPLTAAFVELCYTAPVVCAVATIAAVQEGSCIAADHDVFL